MRKLRFGYFFVAVPILPVMLLVLATSALAQLDSKNPAESWKKFVNDYNVLVNGTNTNKIVAIGAKVDALFDYEAMTDRVLTPVATEWKALSPADQSRFKIAFRQLVQQYMLRHLHECYRNSSFVGVSSETFTVQTKGATCTSLPSQYVFTLKKSGDTALIEDIVVDDVSLVMTYKNQIVKAVKTAGFESIITRIHQAIARMKLESQ